MARLSEVTEEEIISAGLEIEQLGKAVNPGSIRTKLGDRGGIQGSGLCGINIKKDLPLMAKTNMK
ncbi:hypothetical protein CXF72_13435 [Psychromonas sp. MB-3u-54]|nr:hypothetical protein CXF72_13435 [Psychromonas sp. MB-3u-54]